MDHAVVEGEIAALGGAGPARLSLETDRLARIYVEAGVEPQFQVSSDFSSPELICLDRYWNLRVRADPSVHTAASCAHWINAHVAAQDRRAVTEVLALGYGFITREHTESQETIDAAAQDLLPTLDADGALFVLLVHAGRLRGQLDGEELHRYLMSSPWAAAAGKDDPLLIALQAFAAFAASHKYKIAYARKLFDQAWNAWRTGRASRAAADIALNGLALAAPRAGDGDGLGELLVERAGEALQMHPDSHGFHARLAVGQEQRGDFDGARRSVDRALRLLPAMGWRNSFELLQQQYLLLRARIESATVTARWEREAAAHMMELHTEFERHKAAFEDSARELEDLVGREREKAAGRGAARVRSAARDGVTTMWVAGMLIVLAGVGISLAGTRLSLGGQMDLAARLWVMAGTGAALIVSAVVVVAAVWLLSGTSWARR